MNLKEYRVVFAVTALILILIGASPLLGVFLSFPNKATPFSELYVLGQDHIMTEYPLAVTNDTNYRIILGIGNHMHVSSYYRVDIKFRNQTQPYPDSSSSTPSSLSPLYEYRAFVGDEQAWEATLVFKLQNVTSEGNSTVIGNVLINGETFTVNSSAEWDSQNGGFFYQLFFELQLYNSTSNSFEYNNRSAWIWLKVNI
jgi:hypothetical protein